MKGLIIKGTLVLALAGGILAGCTKNSGSAPGGSIRFVATAGAAVTRTAYSGVSQTESSVTMERIDWITGDQFTVWSDKAAHIQDASRHTADYIVQQVTTEGLRSRAIVDPVDHNGLQWGDATGSFSFYARYPADESKIDGSKMSAEIPVDQTWGSSVPAGLMDMRYAYMFASATASRNADAVRLEFYPMFTPFLITVGSGENETVTLRSFTLSSASQPLAGTFEISCDHFDAADPTSAVTAVNPEKKNIEVQLGGVQVTSSSPLTFMVAALPQDLTDLTITFVGDEIGTRTLALRKESGFLSFAGCHKHVITGLSFPKYLTVGGEQIEWDHEAMGEDLIWDN